jgi:Homeodomain-like domain
VDVTNGHDALNELRQLVEDTNENIGRINDVLADIVEHELFKDLGCETYGLFLERFSAELRLDEVKWERPVRRAQVALRTQEGASQEQIASELHVSKGTVNRDQQAVGVRSSDSRGGAQTALPPKGQSSADTGTSPALSPRGQSSAATGTPPDEDDAPPPMPWVRMSEGELAERARALKKRAAQLKKQDPLEPVFDNVNAELELCDILIGFSSAIDNVLRRCDHVVQEGFLRLCYSGAEEALGAVRRLVETGQTDIDTELRQMLEEDK